MSSSLSSSRTGSVIRAIVTGANKGIGFEIAKKLSLQGVHVIMACRDIALGAQAAEEIKRSSSCNSSSSSADGDGMDSIVIDVMELDISKPESITKFVSEVISLGNPIDILVNNAAIGIYIYSSLS